MNTANRHLVNLPDASFINADKAWQVEITRPDTIDAGTINELLDQQQQMMHRALENIYVDKAALPKIHIKTLKERRIVAILQDREKFQKNMEMLLAIVQGQLREKLLRSDMAYAIRIPRSHTASQSDNKESTGRWPDAIEFADDAIETRPNDVVIQDVGPGNESLQIYPLRSPDHYFANIFAASVSVFPTADDIYKLTRAVLFYTAPVVFIKRSSTHVSVFSYWPEFIRKLMSFNYEKQQRYVHVMVQNATLCAKLEMQLRQRQQTYKNLLFPESDDEMYVMWFQMFDLRQ